MVRQRTLAAFAYVTRSGYPSLGVKKLTKASACVPHSGQRHAFDPFLIAECFCRIVPADQGNYHHTHGRLVQRFSTVRDLLLIPVERSRKVIHVGGNWRAGERNLPSRLPFRACGWSGRTSFTAKICWLALSRTGGTSTPMDRSTTLFVYTGLLVAWCETRAPGGGLRRQPACDPNDR